MRERKKFVSVRGNKRVCVCEREREKKCVSERERVMVYEIECVCERERNSSMGPPWKDCSDDPRKTMSERSCHGAPFHKAFLML